LDYALIAATAFAISGLTLFSGFGLGTVLMPAFALFFPVPVAIAATAVVHLANNLFKLALVGRQADWSVVARFSLPAAGAAILGASALVMFAGLPVLATYEFLGREHEVTVLNIVIGVLIVAFALLELSPAFAALAFPPRYLVLGGLISGFFGGLSGNQGACHWYGLGDRPDLTCRPKTEFPWDASKVGNLYTRKQEGTGLGLSLTKRYR
jgi:hypothetical protein